MKFFIFGENGRVSRSNSGDLAGKCADFNSQQKIAYAENSPCLLSLYRLSRFIGFLFDRADNLCNLFNL